MNPLVFSLQILCPETFCVEQSWCAEKSETAMLEGLQDTNQKVMDTHLSFLMGTLSLSKVCLLHWDMKKGYRQFSAWNFSCT